MKLIIAGSRTLWPRLDFIHSAITMLKICSELPITEIVCGCAEGVDNEGEHWASHMNIPVRRFPVDWEKHGKAAGPIRNKQMADYADSLLLIWDGESKGSANMLKQMKVLNKPVYEVILRKNK